MSRWYLIVNLATCAIEVSYFSHAAIISLHLIIFCIGVLPSKLFFFSEKLFKSSWKEMLRFSTWNLITLSHLLQYLKITSTDRLVLNPYQPIKLHIEALVLLMFLISLKIVLTYRKYTCLCFSIDIRLHSSETGFS